MATIELSIDLGSKFITIYQKGIGLVLREPAIAIATKVRNRLESATQVIERKAL